MTKSTLGSGSSNLMEEIQKMKDEEQTNQNVQKKVFNAEERLTQLLSSYIIPENGKEDNDESGSSDGNDDKENDDDNSSCGDEESDDEGEIDTRIGKNEHPSFRSGNHDWNTRKFQQIGQKLQNYDFHDESSARLFGYSMICLEIVQK